MYIYLPARNLFVPLVLLSARTLRSQLVVARRAAAAAAADLEHIDAAKNSLELALCAVTRYEFIRALCFTVNLTPGSCRFLGGLPPAISVPLSTSNHDFQTLDDSAARISEARSIQLDQAGSKREMSHGSVSKPWAAVMHDSLIGAAADLNLVWRRVEPDAALTALGTAVFWNGQHDGGLEQLTVAASSHEGTAAPVAPALRVDMSALTDAVTGIFSSPVDFEGTAADSVVNKTAATYDNAVDSEIERLLRTSGTSVRVQPRGKTGELQPRATKSANTMAINDAAQAFENAWHDGVSQNQAGAGGVRGLLPGNAKVQRGGAKGTITRVVRLGRVITAFASGIFTVTAGDLDGATPRARLGLGPITSTPQAASESAVETHAEDPFSRAASRHRRRA